MKSRFGVGLSTLALVVLASCSVESGREGQQPDENLGEAQDAVVSCPGGSTVQGIDISEFQGHPNFNSIAASGVKFVITRTNDGSHNDPTFDTNWAGIKAAGMIRGAYQFFEPGNSALGQAQYIVSKVGMLGPGDLPCMIDVEKAGTPASGTYASEIQTWVNYVEQHTGKKPMVYTGKYFWDPNVNSTAFGSYMLVDPAYFGNCYQPNGVAPTNCWQGQAAAGNCPNTANGWSKASFWQYSDSGNVPGISGHVDMDIFYGTQLQLELIAQDAYAAQLVSVSVPATVTAGSVFNAKITYKNIGKQSWNTSTRVGTTNMRDRTSVFADPGWIGANKDRPAQVTGTVAPGATYAFTFKMDAPMTPGAHVEDFGLVQEGVAWFADQGGPSDTAVSMHIDVTAPPATTSSTTGATTGTGVTTGAGATTGSGSTTDAGVTTATGAGGGTSGAGGSGGGTGTPGKSGCKCEAAGAASSNDWAALGAGALGVFVARRRKQSRR